MSAKDGGSAFPLPSHGRHGVQAGMTLRDYFAAKADISVYTPFNNLHEMLGRKPTVGEMAEYIAGLRFIEADAMLAAREVQK